MPFAGQINDFFGLICRESQGETDSDGNGMGPGTDETPTWMVHLQIKWDRVRHPLINGGKRALTLIEDRCAEVGSEHSLRGMAMGVEWNMGRGGRGWRSGVHDFLQPPQWTGTYITSLLCFAAVGWTITPMRSLVFAISTMFICTVMVFVPWRASVRPIWTMSVITLFGFLTLPFMISVMVLVIGFVALSVLVLGGPWFLFFFWAAHGMPAPHDAAVHCAEVMVWVTIGENGFLILICHQGLSNTMCIRSGGGPPSMADTTLPWLEDTSGGKSGRHPACVGRI